MTTNRDATPRRPTAGTAAPRLLTLRDVNRADRAVALGRLRPDGRVPVPETDPHRQPGGPLGRAGGARLHRQPPPSRLRIGPLRSRDDPRSTRPAAQGTNGVEERPSTCRPPWLMVPIGTMSKLTQCAYIGNLARGRCAPLNPCCRPLPAGAPGSGSARRRPPPPRRRCRTERRHGRFRSPDSRRRCGPCRGRMPPSGHSPPSAATSRQRREKSPACPSKYVAQSSMSRRRIDARRLPLVFPHVGGNAKSAFLLPELLHQRDPLPDMTSDGWTADQSHNLFVDGVTPRQEGGQLLQIARG